jgi:lipopolysaccharide transport system ATP-binding protein
MTVEEITSLMPEIEAFAEIGDYMDQPVRVYSSGMQMRVAFSVATVRRPDILIVDEALSVGDAYFQHKSFDRIREFRKQGTTLLIVSHDKQAIQSICDRAILLNAGRLAREGDPEGVMDFYNALLADRENQCVIQLVLDDNRIATQSGTGEATIDDVALLNDQGEKIDVAGVGASVTLVVKAKVHAPIPKLVVGYMIKDRLGQPMFGTNTHLKEMPLYDLVPDQEIIYHFTFPMNLGPGNYSVAVALTSSETHLTNNFEWRDLAMVFNVVNLAYPHFAGCVWLDPVITIQGEEST